MNYCFILGKKEPTEVPPKPKLTDPDGGKVPPGFPTKFPDELPGENNPKRYAKNLKTLF